MSEQLFGEATVHLTPDLTGFVSKLKTEVKGAVESVEKTPAAKIRIAPALTRDFVGNLRKQVNLAVAQAQKGIKPIQIRAVLSDTSRAAIAREIRTGAQTVTAGARPARGGVAAGTGAAVTATRDLAAASLGLADVEKIIAQAESSRIPILGQLTAAEQAAAKSRVEGARATEIDAAVTRQDAIATTELTKAKIALDEAQLHAAGTSAQAARFRAADALAVSAIAQATRTGDQATRQAAEAFRLQIRTIPGATAALDEHSRAAREAASNLSQLRRGVLSTSLSFLGIRGATLAASARFLAGAAAIAVFAKAISSAAATAQQLNVFRATTQATAVALERVASVARALGADIRLPGVTAQDAAEAMTELAKAGLNVEDSIAGARGVLQLATAAAIDNAQAVELAANAINAFGLAGRDATHVADVFANAANAAQGSIVDIGIAFQQASAAGRQVGLSFEDTSEFLTVLARNGLKGSDAGTSLRTALIRLIKPTKEARGALAELGVEVRDAQGNLRPDVFIQLAEATRNLSPAARDAKIALIGGQDAFRAITILGRQTIDQFIALRQELREQGTAAELAEARMSGLRGALEGLSNSLSGIGLRAGQELTPALQGVVVGLSGASAGLSESGTAAAFFGSAVDALQVSLQTLGATLTTIGGVVLPIAGGLASIVTAIGVPTILTAVVAYKGLGLALNAITAAKTGPIAVAFERLALQIGLLKLEGAAGGMRALASALGAAALSTTGLVIGAAAVAAGLFFLITRESEAERATRKLKEATEGLTAANEKLQSSQDARRDTRLSVTGAELGVLEAQTRVAKARAAIQASGADKGTFTATKQNLELRVAIDGVSIAQGQLSDAIERANAAQDEAAQAAIDAEKALRDEISAIDAVGEAQRKLGPVGPGAQEGRGRQGQDLDLAREIAASKRVSELLQERAQASREEGSAEAIATARRIELLDAVARSVNAIPTERQITIALETPNLKATLDQLVFEFQTTGTKIEDALFKGLTTLGQSPEITAAILDLADKLGIELVPAMTQEGHLGGSGLTDGVAAGIDEGTPKVMSAIDRLLNATKGRLSGLERQALDLSIAGASDAAKLANLEQQRRQQEQRVAAQEQRLREGKVAEETVRREKEELDRIIGEIRTLRESMAADSKRAADEQEKKQDEIFDNFLRILGIRREARQQAIEDAALTEGSGDDLSATRRLRRLINVQIQRIQERIAAARKEGQSVQVLITALRTLEGIYRDLGREVRSLQKTRREEIQARIAESNALDIEFAQTTGNKQAEIRARLREIARLKRLQDATRRGTIEYRRYRNLIAEQEKAIRDIADELGKVNNANAEMQFKFLQTQAGFAANLLSNLIPGGIGGNLGGTSASGGGVGSGGGADIFSSDVRFPGELNLGTGGRGVLPAGFGGAGAAFGGGGFGDPSKAATALAAGKIEGPTRGQQARELQLLVQIRDLLRQIRGGTSHPDAKHVRATGGGGGGGSDILAQ